VAATTYHEARRVPLPASPPVSEPIPVQEERHDP